MITRRILIGSAAVAATVAAMPIRLRAQTRELKIAGSHGAELYVRDWGEGQPVILTHAWPLNADIWDYQAVALAEAGYRVIAYDRRGFGRSDKPDHGYDYDSFADDLAAVIKETGAREAALFGYSMGGGEVVRYFSHHGGEHVVQAGFIGAVGSYVLKTEDNPHGLKAEVFEGIKAGVRGDRRAYLEDLLRNVFFDVSKPATYPVTEEILQAALEMAMQADLDATVACVDAFSRTDFRPELEAVDVPTLVVHGTADIPVPIALAHNTAAGIAKARMIEYEGASHGIVVTERERVVADLLDFLKS